jgi:hypothetical protein
VPAPAVIPAPVAYIKVVAVKKLVVQFERALYWSGCKTIEYHLAPYDTWGSGDFGLRPPPFYSEKNRAFEAYVYGVLNKLAEYKQIRQPPASLRDMRAWCND